MELSRRKFLKLSGASALGAIVFNGCGIPEQELIVQSPLNMPEDQVSSLEAWYATSSGPYGNGEGILVRIIQGRAIKIEGNPDHPVNNGKSSGKNQAGLQGLYNPDRILTPMKRVGIGASRRWINISWEEALSEISNSVKTSSESNSLAIVTNKQNGTIGEITTKFAKTLNSKVAVVEAVDHTNLNQSMLDVFGQNSIPNFDLGNSDFILSFGADFLGTWLSPVKYSRDYGQFRQENDHRGKFIQIEPRMSLTGANADKWIYNTPGTEGKIALSIAYVIMTEHADKVDSSVVSQLTDGQGASQLSSFAPSNISNETGVSPEVIKDIAENIISHKHSIIIGGGSAGAHSNGVDNLNAIYSLNILISNIGKEGGVIFNPESSGGNQFSASSLADIQNLISDMNAKNIDTAIIRGANPVHSLPSSLGFEDALVNVKNLYCISTFMDDTAAMANIILPESVYLESWGDDVPNPLPGYDVVTFQQPVVKTLNDSRPYGDIILGLSKNIGGDLVAELPWETTKDAIRDKANKLYQTGRGSIKSVSFEGFWNGLLQRGVWVDQENKGATSLSNINPLPNGISQIQYNAQSGANYHLLPFETNTLGDGIGANIPWLQNIPDLLTTAAWETWMEINPQTADKEGIVEGDIIKITSPFGNINALAYVHPAAAPNVISVPMGLGHKHYGRFRVGPNIEKYRTFVGQDRGSNIFSIIPDDNRLWASMKVTISKTGNWKRLPKFEGDVLPTLPDQTQPTILPITGLNDHHNDNH